jgi:cytosolic 5'-nucleotidase 3
MEDVFILNQNSFDKKKNKFKTFGINYLQVITDFDKTLTKGFVDGQKQHSIIAQIRQNNYISSEYVIEANKLFEKYHPIEIDSNLTILEKIPFMEEWWSKHINLLAKSGVTREILEDIINKEYLKPRGGLLDFFDFLSKNNIPLLIFSAALGDSIELFLKKYGKKTPNIKIISNFFDFDKKGFAKGYKGEIVHVFNKGKHKINDPMYEKNISKRKNILLLGDSIGDTKMADQMNFDEIIKIGFLNKDSQKDFDELKNNFDVIILNDGSLEFVNNLLKELFE